MTAQRLVVEPPEPTDVGPPVYANAVHISLTPFDFRFSFSLLAPSTDGMPGEPELVGEVVLPPAAMESFIDVVKAELAAHTRRFGSLQPALQQAAR